MFDFFITPWLIRIIYWISQILLVVASLKIFTGGNLGFFGSYINGFVGGLLFLIVGSLLLRLLTELLIVVFKLVENTQYLKKNDDNI